MTEHSDDRDFIACLKSDVRQTVDLYFAPVKAVVREFQHAIEKNDVPRADSAASHGVHGSGEPRWPD